MMELKTIMRQKDDKRVVQPLNRIRTGSQTTDDIALLQMRIVNRSNQCYLSDILHVFTTNQPTNEQNEAC